MYRTIDRIKQWLRYPQPTRDQKDLLGLYTDSFDIDFVAKRLASESSAEYVVNNMRQARNFPTDYDLHEWAATQCDPEMGLILEFGVATGRTLNHWARLFPTKRIHGFDSFDGLPETWSWNFRAGHFSQRLPRVRSNCQLYVGWFSNTLPDWLKQNSGPVAFLHVDCDLYSSAKYVLDQLKDRIQVGTIIVFDEYLNFPGWEQDEHRAWHEFVAVHGIEYEYLGFVSKHQQVVVKVTKV